MKTKKISNLEREKLRTGGILNYALSTRDCVSKKTVDLMEVMMRPANRLLILSGRLKHSFYQIESYGRLPDALEELSVLEKHEGTDMITDELNEFEISCSFAEKLEDLGIFTKINIDDTINNAMNRDMHERHILLKMSFACKVLALSHFVYQNDAEWGRTFDGLHYSIASKSHEAIGYWTARLERMKDCVDSQATKKEQRKIKERYVLADYLKTLKDPTERAILNNLKSESEMALRVKKRVEPELRKAKTQNGVSVLKCKVDRKGQIKYSGFEKTTIIDIFRKRDKTKIPFYPWENKETSRT